MNLSLIFIVVVGLFGASPRKELSQGRSAYEEGRFDEALEYFKDAQMALPEEAIVEYNLGCTHYRLGNYDKAAQSFGIAAQTGKNEVSVSALYNLGNSLFHMGDWEGAIHAYEQALLQDENHDSARFNLEYVKRMIKEMMQSIEEKDQDRKYQEDGDEEKDRNSPENQQGEEEQGEEEQGEQEQGEQEQGEQEQGEQEQGEQEQGYSEKKEPIQIKDEEEGQESKAAGRSKEDQEGFDTRESSQSRTLDMTPEEAEYLLRALAQEEQEIRERNARKVRPGLPGGGPDW